MRSSRPRTKLDMSLAMIAGYCSREEVKQSLPARGVTRASSVRRTLEMSTESMRDFPRKASCRSEIRGLLGWIPPRDRPSRDSRARRGVPLLARVFHCSGVEFASGADGDGTKPVTICVQHHGSEM
jgi:plasmid stabilization system protein ParE